MMVILNDDHTQSGHCDGDEDSQVAVPNSADDSFVRVFFDIKLPTMKLKENFI